MTYFNLTVFTHPFSETVWDSLRKGRESGICTVSDFDKFEFWDSLISQQIQWVSSEIWRSNSVLWSLCFCANCWICCCCLCLRRFITLFCLVLFFLSPHVLFGLFLIFFFPLSVCSSFLLFFGRLFGPEWFELRAPRVSEWTTTSRGGGFCHYQALLKPHSAG